jgi:cytochrome b561
MARASDRYNALARTFHWVIALLIAGMFPDRLDAWGSRAGFAGAPLVALGAYLIGLAGTRS